MARVGLDLTLSLAPTRRDSVARGDEIFRPRAVAPYKKKRIESSACASAHRGIGAAADGVQRVVAVVVLVARRAETPPTAASSRRDRAVTPRPHQHDDLRPIVLNQTSSSWWWWWWWLPLRTMPGRRATLAARSLGRPRRRRVSWRRGSRSNLVWTARKEREIK